MCSHLTEYTEDSTHSSKDRTKCRGIPRHAYPNQTLAARSFYTDRINDRYAIMVLLDCIEMPADHHTA